MVRAWPDLGRLSRDQWDADRSCGPADDGLLFVSTLSRFRLRLSRALRAFEANPEQVEPNPRTFTVALERDLLDGGWVAECLDLPGCVSQGETQHEALENILDAIAEVLAVRMEQQLPPDTDSPDGENSRRVALTV